MKTIELQGKNIEEILSKFKEENSLNDSDFTYEVIQDAKKGLFGIFGQDAIVRFTIDDLNNRIAHFLRKFAVLYQIEIGEILMKNDEQYVYVEINNVSDAGILIGKDGKILLAVQHLLNQIFMNNSPEKRVIILDIEGYKERNESIITKKVQSIVNQILRSKRSFTMDPMNASQRRVVHHTIKDIPEIKTMTIGEGQMKRIVLSYQGKREPRYNAKNPD